MHSLCTVPWGVSQTLLSLKLQEFGLAWAHLQNQPSVAEEVAWEEPVHQVDVEDHVGQVDQLAEEELAGVPVVPPLMLLEHLVQPVEENGGYTHGNNNSSF